MQFQILKKHALAEGRKDLAKRKSKYVDKCVLCSTIPKSAV